VEKVAAEEELKHAMPIYWRKKTRRRIKNKSFDQAKQRALAISERNHENGLRLSSHVHGNHANASQE
jgi:hypothetical protein